MRSIVVVVTILGLSGCHSPERYGRPAHLVARGDNGAAPSSTDASVVVAPSARHPAFFERVAERNELVRVIEGGGVHDGAVLAAMRTVPRHEFVLPVFRPMAYEDRPLPIVGQQTISQPSVVAMMTQAVRPTSRSKCLEVGTGSGYQAAVLAELCKKTFSIEYYEEVARFGEEHLRALGYGPERVVLRVGDGYAGWEDEAPFDAIVVTAAPEKVPRPLLDQLAVNGRLVIPVGEQNRVQVLELWTRVAQGSDEGAFKREALTAVRFVPFVGH
jgi:protein-L-isoaspartate(D-aspartate) O-methyltransferase